MLLQKHLCCKGLNIKWHYQNQNTYEDKTKINAEWD